MVTPLGVETFLGSQISGWLFIQQIEGQHTRSIVH